MVPLKLQQHWVTCLNNKDGQPLITRCSNSEHSGQDLKETFEFWQNGSLGFGTELEMLLANPEPFL